jgi:hypothetical protein
MLTTKDTTSSKSHALIAVTLDSPSSLHSSPLLSRRITGRAFPNEVQSSEASVIPNLNVNLDTSSITISGERHLRLVDLVRLRRPLRVHSLSLGGPLGTGEARMGR